MQAFLSEASFPGGDIVTEASQIDVKLRLLLEKAFLEAIEKVRYVIENEQGMLKFELSELLEAEA